MSTIIIHQNIEDNLPAILIVNYSGEDGFSFTCSAASELEYVRIIDARETLRLAPSLSDSASLSHG